MAETHQNFHALTALLNHLHDTLFEPEFELVSWEILRDSVMEISKATNAALEEYHELEGEAEKMTMKPTLHYVQDLLDLMIRLLKFEPTMLTKHNQILLDLQKMILDKEALIKGTYTEMSQRELDIMADGEFREMLESFVEHFLRTAPKDL